MDDPKRDSTGRLVAVAGAVEKPWFALLHLYSDACKCCFWDRTVEDIEVLERQMTEVKKMFSID
jgi:hypothetical protein